MRPKQLEKVAVDQRANACANPTAIYHGQPLTIEDVLSSPLVVDPLRLHRDRHADGGAAGVLVTTTERAAALRHAPVPGAKRA